MLELGKLDVQHFILERSTIQLLCTLRHLQSSEVVELKPHNRQHIARYMFFNQP